MKHYRSFNFFLLLILFVTGFATQAFSQEIVSDFGAETIESDKPFPTPLPVEVAEQQDEALKRLTANNNSQNFQSLENPISTSLPADSPRFQLGKKSEKDQEATTTILNVKDADISALIKTFSKLTGRNYIVDSSVKGRVTIHQQNPVPISEALRIFDSVLLLKGFTTVPVDENIWKVVKTKDAKTTTIPLLEDTPDKPSDTMVTKIVRLKHVPAQDMQQLMSQFATSSGSINAVEGTNSLIMVGSAANIKRLETLASKLDIPATDQDITIFPIQHADSKDIADKIKEILGQDDSSSTNSRSRNMAARTRINRRFSNARGARLNRSAQISQTKRRLPVKIISDERTNSLIVVADEELTAKVRGLIEQLDSALDRSGGRFYVYNVKHADAEELAKILNNLISGSTNSSSSGNNKSSNGSSFSRTNRSKGSNTGQTGKLANKTSQQGKVSFEDDVFITPDAATNSLIINASRTDYQRLKEVISALDVKRRQVLVEATLLEVTLNKETGFGVELQGTAANQDGGILAQSSFGSLNNLLTNPTALSDLTIAAASSGTLTLPGGIVIPSQAILVKALSRHSNVNVLSAPTILATDNEEAEIIVGENVPFVTSTSTNSTNLGNTFNQVERQDVGITLRITPQISSGDFIVLDIFVEISNVVQGTRNDPNGPTTTIRTTDTRVEVKNDQMIVTGGLISDTVNESTRGVPFLEEIPVLGNLFKREDNNRRRTNLLVFITPRIVSDQYDARDTTKASGKKVGKIINQYKISPDRHEVLHNKNIDNVVPTASSDGKLPTMITPPNTYNKKVKQYHKKSRLEIRTNKDTIDIAVKPNLPSKKTVSKKRKPASTVKLKAQQKHSLRSASTIKGTFVVLRNIGDKDKLDISLPFSFADNLGTLGVIVSEHKNSKDFFRVGGRYTFVSPDDANSKVNFISLGVYGSKEEAATVHKALNSESAWYIMPPKDLVSLGHGNWQAEQAE